MFSLPRVVPCFPLLGLTPSGLFKGSISTLIYTSELILRSTIHIAILAVTSLLSLMLLTVETNDSFVLWFAKFKYQKICL